MSITAGELTRNGDDSGPDAVPLSPAVDALFSVPGATEGTTQWRAERMQLVNWGGFDGVTPIDFDPGSTLLSGASGTGKSTILDAYTALLMPVDVPFNGASNDAAGRSRGAGQRSLVSYLRGQTDTTADGDGDERAQVLRGDGQVTWGGVAVTYVNDHGDAFTAARLYYVPVAARLGGDVQQRMLTFDGRLTLRDFDQFAGEAFIPTKLKAHVPGLVTHDTYGAFAARLFTRLGIGANGDGDKALRLLAKVQAGHQIKTVDALYKEMVLERPATYAAADQALVHFDALADTYRRMEDERRKRDLLSNIPDAWDRLAAARATIESVDAFGVSAPGVSPLTLWALRREADMVENAANDTRKAHAEADTIAREAETRLRELRGDIETLRREYEQAGGGDLRSLAHDIEAAEQEVASRGLALRELTGRVQAVLLDGSDLADHATFTATITASQVFAAGYGAQRTRINEQIEALQPAAWDLSSKIGDLDAQLRDLEGRESRVPSPLLRLREQICAATGMREADLPFVAELVDVPVQHQQWRTAIETVLSAAARKMLVPAEMFQEFSRRIDPLKLRGVIRFEAATLGLSDAPRPAADTVVGKLVFKDSQYRGWVTSYLADRNALCVATSAELNGPGLRVTAAGQQRRGTSGSHGRGDERNILGFSNADLITDLKAERDALRSQHESVDKQRAHLRTQLVELEAKHTAYAALSGATFAQIDVHGSQARVDELTKARAAILTGNDQLQGLEGRMRDLAKQEEKANRRAILDRNKADSTHQAWLDLCERKDAVVDELIVVENSQEALLSDDQAAALEVHFVAVCGQDDPNDLARWPVHQANLRSRLTEAQNTARNVEKSASAELVKTFGTYLDTFPDANLDASLGSYPDFARILEEIQQVGLVTRIAEWRETLMNWSGQDLVPLAQAMQTAVDDIDDRMGPINDILRKLPFGATSDRLRMQMRRLTREQVVAFRKQLKRLSSGATLTLDDAAMRARFRELEAFMATLRSAKDPRYDAKLSSRDDLLDVRRHVEIRAERYSTDGRLLSNYTSLGFKSGGETQELIAFIVGAALRYRLGDEDRSRPRFAPVFLDEGFIKADAEFASRAVQAWTGLGFQLIVGAPLDKVAALEPHMDAFLLVTKNQQTKRSRVRAISDAERADARRQVARE